MKRFYCKVCGKLSEGRMGPFGVVSVTEVCIGCWAAYEIGVQDGIVEANRFWEIKKEEEKCS